jgi:hypothetical protein
VINLHIFPLLCKDEGKKIGIKTYLDAVQKDFVVLELPYHATAYPIIPTTQTRSYDKGGKCWQILHQNSIREELITPFPHRAETHYKPPKWLFEGQKYDHYSTRSVQNSFAMHLHEAGTDIRIMQELVGHNSAKTIERYTYVSNRTIQRVQSLLDNLMKSKKCEMNFV